MFHLFSEATTSSLEHNVGKTHGVTCTPGVQQVFQRPIRYAIMLPIFFMTLLFMIMLFS